MVHTIPRRGRRPALAVAAAFLAGALTLLPAPADASLTGGRLPSTNPHDIMPTVVDGRVNAIARAGTQLVVGGTFTSIVDSPPNGGANRPRTRLATINADTGAVIRTFLPAIDGEVVAIAVAPNGASVYIAGSFTRVNGVARDGLARIRLSDGALVSAFAPPAVDGPIYDLGIVGGAVVVAGEFDTVGTDHRSMLVGLDPTTGAVLPSPAVEFAGTHNGGVTKVVKFDVTPDGSRLLALGNFTTVDGLDRNQVVLLDLTTAPASVTPWQTSFYDSDCAMVFNSHVRDLDISADGTYAVISSSGSWRPPPASCDTIARFELAPVAGLQPTWANYTGGDTTHAVAIDGGVVYVGGHMRWVNNPLGNNVAGPGAVARSGLAALDQASGMPLGWNPGRSRGQGVFDFLVTEAGLWAGSDTSTWAGEPRGRLAFFPFPGGTTFPPDVVGVLPGEVYLLGRPSGGANRDDVRHRTYTGAGVPGAETVTRDGTPWRDVRGAFSVGSTVFTFHADGTFRRRSFDGTTFGPPTVIDTLGNTIAGEASTMTGLAYDPAAGRIYYTLAGQDALYWRGFSPAGGVIEAIRHEVAGDLTQLRPSRIQGMFLSGSLLYFADRDTGVLWRVGFRSGAVTSLAVRRELTGNWRSQAMFVWDGPTP